MSTPVATRRHESLSKLCRNGIGKVYGAVIREWPWSKGYGRVVWRDTIHSFRPGPPKIDHLDRHPQFVFGALALQ